MRRPMFESFFVTIGNLTGNELKYSHYYSKVTFTEPIVLEYVDSSRKENQQEPIKEILVVTYNISFVATKDDPEYVPFALLAGTKDLQVYLPIHYINSIEFLAFGTQHSEEFIKKQAKLIG